MHPLDVLGPSSLLFYSVEGGVVGGRKGRVRVSSFMNDWHVRGALQALK